MEKTFIDDFLSDLPDADLPDADSGVLVAERTIAPPTVIVEAKKSRAEVLHDDLRSLEDDLLSESLETVRDALRFKEIDPEHPDEVPDKWVEELGIEKATLRHRVARGALLPQSKAPAGLLIAKAVGMGIISARSTEKMAPRTLNYQYVQMVTMPQFKSMEIEDD